jgi:hypothetical protein
LQWWLLLPLLQLKVGDELQIRLIELLLLLDVTIVIKNCDAAYSHYS